MSRQPVPFADVIERLYRETEGNGVLLTSAGKDGNPNVMTIGWGLYGRAYHGNPTVVVAVRPACHTFGLLDEIGEFVLAVPTVDLAELVAFCGTASGRDGDKFTKTGLTPIPSFEVTPVSIEECPINVECRIYHKERPPHGVLTPEHREKPVEAQHTIYYAEVLGAYTAE